MYKKFFTNFFKNLFTILTALWAICNEIRILKIPVASAANWKTTSVVAPCGRIKGHFGGALRGESKAASAVAPRGKIHKTTSVVQFTFIVR